MDVMVFTFNEAGFCWDSSRYSVRPNRTDKTLYLQCFERVIYSATWIAFTIGVAGLYLLAYLSKQVFLRLPFVEVAMGHIEPEVSVDQLFDGVGFTEALFGLGFIVLRFAGIAGSRYLAMLKINNKD